MTVRKILAPLGLTINDKKILSFIIKRYPPPKDVAITLFYAYTPVPKIVVHSDPIMEKMKQNLNYRRQQLIDQEAALKQGKQQLTNAGFTSGQVECLFAPQKKGVAQDIIDLARQKQFDEVVLTQRPESITRYFTRSVSRRVAETLDRRIDVFILT